MKNKTDKASFVHQFALYYFDFANVQISNNAITIEDEALFHRCKHVLRMQQGDECILFDRFEHGTFKFEKFEGKNKVVGYLQTKELNASLDPEITFLLPLLKIDALTDAIYSCAEVGINRIQLLTTAKTQTPYSEKLHDKLERVAIAAAEQSKMFAFPTILPPIKLTAWLAEPHEGQKFYFDVGGVPFNQWYNPLDRDQVYYLLVGPEGDLTYDEKLQVQDADFQFSLLTPTVLRSVRSISLISGLFRL